MRFLRLIGRGARDTFDQFLPLVLFSLAWWCANILIVTGPPATATLFAMADPRRQAAVPDWADAVTTFRAVFWRAWAIALWTIPLIAILFWNLLFFGGTDETLAVLAPLWTLMIVLLLVLTAYALAVTGTLSTGVREAFRAATFLLVSRPLTSLGLFLFLVILFGAMVILVVPIIMIGPGLIAAIVNRFALAGLDIEVIDPNRPTPERAVEQQSGGRRDPLFERARRGGSKR